MERKSRLLTTQDLINILNSTFKENKLIYVSIVNYAKIDPELISHIVNNNLLNVLDKNLFTKFIYNLDSSLEEDTIRKIINHYDDPKIVAKVSHGLGEAMKGLEIDKLEVKMQERGY